jgi:predicted secreted Zn-dependent protease
LQFAGDAKLRPTEADFGVTSYESANYSSIAEDGERSGAVERRSFAITSFKKTFNSKLKGISGDFTLSGDNTIRFPFE